MKTFVVTITTQVSIHQYTVDAKDDLLAIQASVKEMNKVDNSDIESITVIHY